MTNSYAVVHDRIFHIGWAEAVFFDLIKEKLKSKLITDDWWLMTIKIYTLFSDRTSITIDDHEIPVIVALPRWINNIFVRWSRPHTVPTLNEEKVIDDTEISNESPYIHKAKIILNIVNQIFMTLIMRLGKWLLHIGRKIFDYRNLIIFTPLLTRLLRRKIHRSAPHEIIISSFAAVKNVVPVWKVVKPTVTLYLHSPMQYIRENYDEYIDKLARWQAIIFQTFVTPLRRRDMKPRHYDQIFTNSEYTRTCASKWYDDTIIRHRWDWYGRAIVKYPNIDQKIVSTPPASEPLEYYIYVGRLVRFIRETDLIIKLANEINIPLIVMWSGPDEEWLKSIAGDTITFIGQVTDIDEKIQIISQSRGLINLTKESCGMGTMEALALWVPVLGYNAGATPEFVNTTNWVLADSKDTEHLIEKFREFHEKVWEREKIKEEFLKRYWV